MCYTYTMATIQYSQAMCGNCGEIKIMWFFKNKPT